MKERVKSLVIHKNIAIDIDSNTCKDTLNMKGMYGNPYSTTIFFLNVVCFLRLVHIFKYTSNYM